jgi:hypothetical protein
MSRQSAYALWFLLLPEEWHWRAMLAARFPACLTVLRGRPWEDCQ